jgi:hypothetical protein
MDKRQGHPDCSGPKDKPSPPPEDPPDGRKIEPIALRVGIEQRVIGRNENMVKPVGRSPVRRLWEEQWLVH